MTKTYSDLCKREYISDLSKVYPGSSSDTPSDLGKRESVVA